MQMKNQKIIEAVSNMTRKGKQIYHTWKFRSKNIQLYNFKW